MELMVAWFPLAKFLVTVSAFLILGALLYYKHFKTAATVVVVLALLLIFAPIKYDGTASKTAHQQEEALSSSYHEAHSAEVIPPIHVKELSFEEKMRLANTASDNASSEIANGK